MWTKQVTDMIIAGVGETLYMTLFSTFFGYVFGMPLGILLKVSDKEGLRPNAVLYKILDVIANIFRSIPFLILLILLIPFTRFLVGKSYGTTATIVPLTIAAIPFIGRMVESSLNEVDPGVIEAARSMGASNLQIVFRVMLVEARTSLISGATIVTGTILGYSAMAGTVGGGGLGDIAVRYGYNRWQTDIMLVTVAILVIIVQLLADQLIAEHRAQVLKAHGLSGAGIQQGSGLVFHIGPHIVPCGGQLRFFQIKLVRDVRFGLHKACPFRAGCTCRPLLAGQEGKIKTAPVPKHIA